MAVPSRRDTVSGGLLAQGESSLEGPSDVVGLLGVDRSARQDRDQLPVHPSGLVPVVVLTDHVCGALTSVLHFAPTDFVGCAAIV